MNDMFKLDFIDDTLALNELYLRENALFAEEVDQLDRLLDDGFQMEKAVQPHGMIRQSGSEILHNTISTTKNVAGAYDNLTSAGGGLIKSSFDMVFDGVTLCVKLISFILRKISLIPGTILAVSHRVGKIPKDIVHRIKGDIMLYITIDDIADLYNKSTLKELDAFISEASQFARGETWGRMFNRRKDEHQTSSGFKHNENVNDMKLARQMSGHYQKLRFLKFELTSVSMKDDTMRDIYFASSSSVKFVDLHGNHHEGSYYEALATLIQDLENASTRLGDIQKSIGEKYDKSRANSNFNDLGPNGQRRITESIRMIAKMVSIVSNVIKCVNADMKTINDSVDHVLKNS